MARRTRCDMNRELARFFRSLRLPRGAAWLRRGCGVAVAAAGRPAATRASCVSCGAFPYWRRANCTQLAGFDTLPKFVFWWLVVSSFCLRADAGSNVRTTPPCWVRRAVHTHTRGGATLRVPPRERTQDTAPFSQRGAGGGGAQGGAVKCCRQTRRREAGRGSRRRIIRALHVDLTCRKGAVARDGGEPAASSAGVKRSACVVSYDE